MSLSIDKIRSVNTASKYWQYKILAVFYEYYILFYIVLFFLINVKFYKAGENMVDKNYLNQLI